MAQIRPIRSFISFEQKQTESGKYYPACLLANEELYSALETVFMLTKSVLSDRDYKDLEILENTLTALSQYRVWKKDNAPEPSTVESHFCLLPQLTGNINFEYSRPDSLPTDALLFSYDEIVEFNDVLLKAVKAINEKISTENDTSALYEMKSKVEPMSNSFVAYLSSWDKYILEENTQFAKDTQFVKN